jgi:hypothetical protein
MMEIMNPVHSKCLEIMRNLTLLPSNCSILSHADGVITSFTASANSQYPENRIAALRGLQNLSGDASSKSVLASAHVLHLLTSCAIRSDPDEKEAAVATLYNITTEPSTVVAITNTRNVIATLVHIAHHAETASHVRLLACEALATTSLWLQTLAGTGTCPEDVPNVLLPSHKTYGWERWN